MYDTNEIPLLVLNMEDNQLSKYTAIIYLSMEGDNYQYFDYDEKNQILDRIKADESVRKAWVARQFIEINTDTKARRDASYKAQPDMSVCSVRF